MTEKNRLDNLLKITAKKEQPTTSKSKDDFVLVERGDGDLKTRFRPQRLSELAPTTSITQLKNLIDNPLSSQIYLFEGKTGTGKTTCARIIAKANICESKDREKPCLECESCCSFNNNLDITEINVADHRKIDDVRELVKDMRFLPQTISKKIYILDEVQQLTPEAQQVLLKVLEEPPEYLLVFLCTTDKKDLNKALIDRALTITFSDVKPKDAQKIIDQILEQHNITTEQQTKIEIFKHSHGSVRALLNNLQAFIQGGELSSTDDEEIPVEIKAVASAILAKDWSKLSNLLKQSFFRKTPENVRIQLENYLRGTLLNKDLASSKSAARALSEISGPLFGAEVSQYNVLVLKCYNALRDN